MFGLFGITHASDGKTRLFTAENVFGEKGRGGMAELSTTPQVEVERIGQLWEGPNACARDLGQKWKVRPCISLPGRSVTTIMEADGPGRITHFWLTVSLQHARSIILRIHWDNEESPSVEAPIGDFFCCGWGIPLKINALPVNVNPTGGMNCFFPMPFREHARVTLENRNADNIGGVYYAVSMEEGPVAENELYFHAAFRRSNPLPYGTDFTILDGVQGKGHYVGTQLSWQQNSAGWWGEGEVKAFIDGDGDFPSY